ncbi:aminotransferase class IV [Gammaproteobacteria bacterium]|jgi:branched-chain amino acid aminotransferase|nr:aminotransferase class IV [Gammaproteobacteria bacterium]MDA9997327.1 aminotransferase class IV [Gammaproteobacteria bacterium]MDC3248153.1 aminotransferase class IV [Gammaproteobacteria bacterium]
MANHIQSHLNKNKDILIYINGSLYKRQDAKISVYDSGFLMGDGIWEGLRLVDGNWIFLDEHIDRLFEGLKAIDINLSMSKSEVIGALEETRVANKMVDNAHARLMVTRGEKVKPFQQPDLSKDGPSLVIILEHSDDAKSNDGIKLATVPQVRGLPMSQDPKLNSHSKLNCILACIQAKKMGADEALMLDPHGFVNTTNSCNFFIIKNGEVFTSSGDYCMNGITRKKVIHVCKENNIPVYEKNFSLVDVYSADEAFITGTLGSLRHVINIDGRSIGNSDQPGPMNIRLKKLYLNL